MANPRNGLSSAFWGPHGWIMLHSVFVNYPLQPTRSDRSTYAYFVAMFGKVLPCRPCRENFDASVRSALLRLAPAAPALLAADHPAFNSRENLFMFGYLLHDAVNRSIGKTSPPYQHVRSFYESRRARDPVDVARRRMHNQKVRKMLQH